MKAYYKTNAPAVLAAMDQHEAESQVITEAGKAFAAHFGGKLLVHNSIHGYRIAGLRFNPKKPVRLWTNPGDCGEQRPRQSITKGTSEERAELKALKEDWAARLPRAESDFAPVMAAMGTDWGNCIFNDGFGMFAYGGWIYVVTGAKLADCMTEIMGSEYQAAREQFDAARKAAKEAA